MAPPKKKKKERVKAPKKIPKLELPLTELSKDWVHIPVADIEAYVNRSTETRHREVAQGKIPGKVKRPMNAFMLYRKAYQDRAKNWCMQHNHQVVSQVCGDSWPLEPEAVRNQFVEWSAAERTHHHEAFPDYKFSPSKPRKKVVENDLDGDSELGDLEWTPSSRVPGPRTRTPAPVRSDSPYQVPHPGFHHGLPSYQPMNPAMGMSPPMGFHNDAQLNLNSRSAFHYSNPGKPLPAPYNHGDMGDTYYQQTILQSQGGQHGVQDILLHKTPSPALLAGIPGASEYDFGDAYTPPPMLAQALAPQSMPPPHAFEQRIDPLLMPQELGIYDVGTSPIYLDGGGGLEGGQHWGAAVPTGHESAGQPTFQDAEFAEYDEGVLRGADESWKLLSMVTTEPFDDWMGAPEPSSATDP